MPHYMMNTHERDGKPHMHNHPCQVTMRYQCQCTGGEVLTIGVVFDLEDVSRNDNEEQFVWTMKRLLRDMKIEARQHLLNREPVAKTKTEHNL